MDKLVIFIAGGIFGIIGILLFYSRKGSQNEEDEQLKQQIYDSVTKLKADIESTVN